MAVSPKLLHPTGFYLEDFKYIFSKEKHWTLWHQEEHSLTLDAPQMVTSEMNITCSWGM